MYRFSNLPRLIPACLLAASIAVFPVEGAAQSKPSEYVLGTTLPLTGVGAFYGEMTRNAANLAVKEINAAGGVNGVPLRVVHEDSQLQSKAGVTAFQKLVDVHKVPAVLSAGSAVVLAQGPVARERKIVLANLGAVSPKLRQEKPWTFTFIPTSDLEARAIANMVADDLKFKEYGIIHVDSDYGIDSVAALTDAMTKKGVRLLVKEQHSVGTVDFRTNLIKIRAANPPALVVFSNITEVGHLANQIRELGIKSQVFGGTFAASGDNLKIAPEAMNGYRGVMVVFNPAANAKAKAFTEAYKKEFGKDPNVHAAITYDTVHLFASAIRSAGYDADAIRKYLGSVKGLSGVMGSQAFDPDNVIMSDIGKWTIEGGKLVPMK